MVMKTVSEAQQSEDFAFDRHLHRLDLHLLFRLLPLNSGLGFWRARPGVKSRKKYMVNSY